MARSRRPARSSCTATTRPAWLIRTAPAPMVTRTCSLIRRHREAIRRRQGRRSRPWHRVAVGLDLDGAAGLHPADQLAGGVERRRADERAQRRSLVALEAHTRHLAPGARGLAGGRRGPAALGRAGAGASRCHRVRRCAGRAPDRGVPTGSCEPDHHRGAQDQQGVDAGARCNTSSCSRHSTHPGDGEARMERFGWSYGPATR